MLNRVQAAVGWLLLLQQLVDRGAEACRHGLEAPKRLRLSSHSVLLVCGTTTLANVKRLRINELDSKSPITNLINREPSNPRRHACQEHRARRQLESHAAQDVELVTALGDGY